MHLVRVESDAMYLDFPELSISECLQLAISPLNSRVMGQYEMSRRKVSRGRKFRGLNCMEAVMNAGPYPLAPSWNNLRKRMEMTDDAFRAHEKRCAGLMLAEALKSKPSTALDLQHGELFMYWAFQQRERICWPSYVHGSERKTCYWRGCWRSSPGPYNALFQSSTRPRSTRGIY